MRNKPSGCKIICPAKIRMRRWKVQGRPGLGSNLRPDIESENRLPELHPEKQDRHGQASVGKMLVGKRAAAHVRPEEQPTKHKRNRAEIINRQRRDRRGAQQMHGLFDEVEPAFAFLPLLHPFNVPGSNLPATVARSVRRRTWNLELIFRQSTARARGFRSWNESGSFNNPSPMRKKKYQTTSRPKRALRQPEQGRQRNTLCQRLAREFFQAGSADHPVFMLGDTFTAKKLFALRASRHRLARGVVETTLVCEILVFESSRFMVWIRHRFPVRNCEPGTRNFEPPRASGRQRPPPSTRRPGRRR